MIVTLWLCVQALAAEPDHSALLATELTQAWDVLADQTEPAHYLALTLTREERISIGATAATRSWSNEQDSTWLDVDLRVGTAELDSTHQLRGFSALDGDSRMVLSVPHDGEYAIRTAIRREIDQQYRDHAERIVMIRANQRVKIEEEDSAHDFSPTRAGVVNHAPPPPLALDIASWEGVLARLSAQVEESEVVHDSSVSLTAIRVTRTFVDSEAARLVHGRLAALAGAEKSKDENPRAVHVRALLRRISGRSPWDGENEPRSV